MNGSNFKNKKILITGGCGFIGSHINDYIMSNDPEKVVIIDNLYSKTSTSYIDPYMDFENFIFKQMDIRDVDKDPYEYFGFDYIIHLAAQTRVPFSVHEPLIDFDINLTGSLKILEIARKYEVPNFIFAGSGGTMYGNSSIPTSENTPFKPISNYGASKAGFEMYLSSYADLYGLKTTSLRFGNVFGPRSIHGVLHDFYVKLKRNSKSLEILGDGNQTKSYLYIKDCVEGFMIAANRNSNGFDTFNMASFPPVSVRKIAELISDYLDVNPEFKFTGGAKGWDGDVINAELDTTKLQSIGWKQKVLFEEGVEHYVDWLNLHYQNKPIQIEKKSD